RESRRMACYTAAVVRARFLSVALGCLLASRAQAALADARTEDPSAYDLRIAIVPVAFQAAVSQGWFGSAGRVEYEFARSFELSARGHIAWWNAITEHHTRNYVGEVMFAWHVSDSIEDESLAGTVYPQDTPAIQGGEPGTDQDLIDIPVSDRMKSGEMRVGDFDPSLRAAMRKLQSLRLGLGFMQAVERSLPDDSGRVRDQLPYLLLGYSFGTHWNLPSSVTGKREVGWRRFYLDLLATTTPLTHAHPDQTPGALPLKSLPVGARIGVEGSLGGLFGDLPGLGLGYQLELGAYPGKGGLEGYLLIALGVEIDAITRR
ncbi:MAG TPA: hypothetical protein VHZ95_15395, partial [Polyangiales bacterium]|nr:hypothetical protein [Polyangiales bacterium]